MAGNKRPQSFRNCDFCSTRFGPLDRLSARFCTRSCAYNHRVGTATPKRGRSFPHLRRARIGQCATCGNEYRATKDHARRRQRYCSRPCYMASRAETSIERSLRVAMTRAGIPFVSQKSIGRYTVDFLLGKTIVEADGDYWHARPEVAAKDVRKDVALSALGYTVIHVRERDIVSDVNAVVASIRPS